MKITVSAHGLVSAHGMVEEFSIRVRTPREGENDYIITIEVSGHEVISEHRHPQFDRYLSNHSAKNRKIILTAIAELIQVLPSIYSGGDDQYADED